MVLICFLLFWHKLRLIQHIFSTYGYVNMVNSLVLYYILQKNHETIDTTGPPCFDFNECITEYFPHL